MLKVDYKSSDKRGKKLIIEHIRKAYNNCSIRDIISGLYFVITDGKTINKVGFDMGDGVYRVVTLNK